MEITGQPEYNRAAPSGGAKYLGDLAAEPGEHLHKFTYVSVILQSLLNCLRFRGLSKPFSLKKPDVNAQDSVRYAYADWPVCSVRNAKSSGGSTTVPLPARIFQLSICGTDRCPGIMCPSGIEHCPPTTTGMVAQKTDDSFLYDELAGTMAAVGSVLAARAEVVVAPPPPPENFIPASSPSCWYTGRTQINEDGSRSFDWEGTQLWVNVQGASYIKMVLLNALVPLYTRD